MQPGDNFPRVPGSAVSPSFAAPLHKTLRQRLQQLSCAQILEIWFIFEQVISAHIVHWPQMWVQPTSTFYNIVALSQEHALNIAGVRFDELGVGVDERRRGGVADQDESAAREGLDLAGDGPVAWEPCLVEFSEDHWSKVECAVWEAVLLDAVDVLLVENLGGVRGVLKMNSLRKHLFPDSEKLRHILHRPEVSGENVGYGAVKIPDSKISENVVDVGDDGQPVFADRHD